MSPCWLSQQFTSVLQILATGIVSSSAFLLPPVLKGERVRSGIPSFTIVVAKPNENKVEKALEWPPGSQCLTPGVGMKSTGFSTPWEASKTSLHQNCWTDWTLRSSQEINSYFPVTASFLLKVENEPKPPKQCVWPVLLAARALSAPAAWLLGSPRTPFPSLAAPHVPAGCPHLVMDPMLGHLTHHQAAPWHGHLPPSLGQSIHPSSPLLKGKSLFQTRVLYCQCAWPAFVTQRWSLRREMLEFCTGNRVTSPRLLQNYREVNK